jgi:hypothetical protein
MQTVTNERGSVIVFITLMVVILMVMVGVGLDTGHMTYARNQGQAAVDAAALSAISGLYTRNPGTVAARAAAHVGTNDYVASPGNQIGAANVSYINYDFDSQSITAAPIATANGVRVALEGGSAISTPLFLTPLMNLLGINTSGSANVNVSAVSVITSRPSIPIAIWSNLCGAEKETKPDVVVKVQHPDKKDDTNSENACWTTFLDCSSGAQDIKALFKVSDECSGGPVVGNLGIDTPICQNRGQVNTTLGTAEDFFMKDHPNGWWLLPVIGGGANCDPQNPTKIVNWAKIYPTEVVKDGKDKFIKANIACSPTYINEFIDTNVCFNHRLVREKVKGM